MIVLVINAGSSSLKYQLYDMDTKEVLAKGIAERIGIEGSHLVHTPAGKDKIEKDIDMPNHKEAIKFVIEALTSLEHGVIKSLDEIDAVGHRVVHGGEKFSTSAKITPQVKDAIKLCYDLAPLHNPPNMIGIMACEEAMPNVPMVAVFDTAFHQTMKEEAYLYALPYDIYKEHGIRRYGFHGTSHRYVSQHAAEILGEAKEDLKIVTCHLGNGSSIAAVKGGTCVDTSMGMTPLAGVCMGTRCGDIDPAIVTFLQEKLHKSPEEIDSMLNKESGVYGISGVSSDFRDLYAAKRAGNKRAAIALELFAYQVKKYIGAYAASMGGIDAIVFTAGIGENTSTLRATICEGLEFLGVEIDDDLNQKTKGGIEGIITTTDSKTKVLVVPTEEEFMIAKETERLIH